MAQCVHCGQTIASGDEVCPKCGGEQPVEWMVKLVYVLAFLFIQGVVYRLLWPNVESFVGYVIYFVVTTAFALGIWIYLRRRSKTDDQSSQ